MSLLRKLFNGFVFGNFFISLCTLSMIFTTFLMNDLPLRLTPFTLFLTFSTYMLYNFHRVSFRLNYSSSGDFLKSILSERLPVIEKIFWIISFLVIVACAFLLSARVYICFIPLAFLAVSYSVPLYKRRGKKIRLLEIFFIKTPVLAGVWGATTTIIPLVEQGMSISTGFVMLQLASRCLFIFALCIPFEMRDLETDRKNNVRTLAVIFGRKNTMITGCTVILIELFLHHLMNSLSMKSILALDASSIIALILILQQNSLRKPLYYKFYIDGTMVVRFLFLYLAFNL
jgi:4-hydroxybenzoate polyprenyltransferase